MGYTTLRPSTRFSGPGVGDCWLYLYIIACSFVCWTYRRRSCIRIKLTRLYIYCLLDRGSDSHPGRRELPVCLRLLLSLCSRRHDTPIIRRAQTVPFVMPSRPVLTCSVYKRHAWEACARRPRRLPSTSSRMLSKLKGKRNTTGSSSSRRASQPSTDTSNAPAEPDSSLHMAGVGASLKGRLVLITGCTYVSIVSSDHTQIAEESAMAGVASGRRQRSPSRASDAPSRCTTTLTHPRRRRRPSSRS